MTFKVLCDVHIAFKVVRFFKEKGYEAIHVNDILDSYYTKDTTPPYSRPTLFKRKMHD